MKISTTTSFIICILILLTSCGCSSGSPSGSGDNSIYYWRTTFTLNDAERDFLKKHAIKKIYVRFFDVDYDWISVVPKGTIRFIDSVPDGIEIVPTIYIYRHPLLRKCTARKKNT